MREAAQIQGNRCERRPMLSKKQEGLRADVNAFQRIWRPRGERGLLGADFGVHNVRMRPKVPAKSLIGHGFDGI